MQSNLDQLYRKTIGFLDKENISYLIIGGLAAGVWGEPRMTQDLEPRIHSLVLDNKS